MLDWLPWLYLGLLIFFFYEHPQSLCCCFCVVCVCVSMPPAVRPYQEIDMGSLIIIIIYPLTARVGAPQMISQPVFSIFPCSLLPSGTWRTPGLFIPWCCLPTSSSVCLVFFQPFTVPCKMDFARPDEQEIWPYHCSLRLFTMVRRSLCGPLACWISARTSSLVTWSLYEMCSIFW